ncbi:helix-turn-helix domain-containing protein [Roseomonas sp. HJA6]|uniref:Helix-turn-helix domain-containing protein n=1 Tax=Roseomonas alba TaxID=2846776 RepID=A0ABS7ACH5_9PROT|nr:helix-turn-helix transcriptional regulator [Neoroseomonas alba]MBW6400012.1 helix-turn-helix domain-containing protein [Neoroseomonas alba]
MTGTIITATGGFSSTGIHGPRRPMGRPRKSDKPIPRWAADIKSARLAAGYRNQKSFGEAVGFSQQAVGDWESGKNRPPPEALPKIAEILGIPAQFLLPPSVAAVFEGQSPLTDAADIDEALARLVAEIHAILTSAGSKPTIQTAVRLAMRAWRSSGGTMTESADPTRLRLEVQKVRELWLEFRAVDRKSP